MTTVTVNVLTLYLDYLKSTIGSNDYKRNSDVCGCRGYVTFLSFIIFNFRLCCYVITQLIKGFA